MKIKKSIMLVFAALCCAGSSVAEEMANYEAVQEQTAKTFQQIEAEMKFNKNWNGNWDVNGNANGNWNVNGNVNTNTETEFLHKDRAPFSKENWTWMHTNPGVRAYKPMEDLTFVGIPVFVAGWIAKSEKYGFKQQGKHSLVTNFKSGVDDYLQFFGPAFTVGLKVAGVEGRSDWGRFLATTAMSYGIMAGFVNGIKYTAKEMRPDGSTANSWPSGHTATAFVGATILHKEYGLTRSPWYSVAGYTVATATGIMRVLNNRHWVSDVFSGAGIGIMSTELAYALSDVIFKGKGLLRNNLTTGKSIIENPSFFSLSMAMGWGSRNMDFDMSKFSFDDGDGDKDFNLKFGTSTAVGVEGAYFFNKYFGVGGRLRVNSSPIKGWQNIVDKSERDFAGWVFEDTEDEMMDKLVNGIDGQYPLIGDDYEDMKFTIDSDHLTEFAADLGVYFNFPLSSRFALGTKFLVGSSIMQELNLSATAKGYKRDVEFNQDWDITNVIPRNEQYTSTWDYFVVDANNTFKAGTGISLTYAHKDNFAWKLFIDYDYTRKTYTMIYNPGEFLLDAVTRNGTPLRNDPDFKDENIQESQSIKKDRNTFTFGGSFAINF